VRISASVRTACRISPASASRLCRLVLRQNMHGPSVRGCTCPQLSHSLTVPSTGQPASVLDTSLDQTFRNRVHSHGLMSRLVADSRAVPRRSCAGSLQRSGTWPRGRPRSLHVVTGDARIANSNQEPDRLADLGEFHFDQDGDQSKTSTKPRCSETVCKH